MSTSREWDRKIEGFRGHFAVDGSLKGVSGRDAARGWAVVQLDNDKEEPWYTIYGTMLEVQRTIKRGVLGHHHGACRLDWSLHHPC